MVKNKVDFNVLEQAFNSAPMSEKKSKTSNQSEMKKKKLISLSDDWLSKIKANYKGTLNSYITMAVYERMQKDGII